MMKSQNQYKDEVKMKKKYNITKEFLLKEYIDKDKTTYTIAEEIGCDMTTICRRLHEYNIPIRKISFQGRISKSATMKKNRKNGVVNSDWIKGKSRWELHPEAIMEMKRTQIKNKITTPGAFKKGHSDSIKGVGSRKNLINRHHIDLNRIDNRNNNILYLIDAAHQSLHKQAYNFLVETNQIKKYTKWFIKKFRPRLYSKKEYIMINKEITKNLRKRR